MDDFLNFLWPAHGFGELRSWSHETGIDNVGLPHPEQHYVDLAHGGVAEVVRLAQLFDALGRDVYFGVLPRIRLSGKAIDAWPETTVLWADVDGKRFENDKRGAIDALLDFELPASVIVDSGHGHHAYWKLKHSVPFAQAQLAMRGIAKAVSGDAVYDAPRVLRIPGTSNHKVTGETEPVRLLRLDTTRTFRFTDFADLIDAATPTEPERDAHWASGWTVQQRGSGERTPMADLPQWLRDTIGTPWPKGSRSEKSWAAVCGLLKHGYDQGDIEIVFANSPVGEKYRERGEEAGHRWLTKTIDKARGALVA